jgi:putative oxidoreductase
MATNFESRLAGISSPALSAFRIVFGLLFTLHGAQKLFDWPVAAPAPVEVGSFPFWWAGLIEFVCGLLITVGFFTRIAAFIASGEMAVAYFWQHWPPLEGPAGSFWPMANNGEPAVLYCFGFLALAAMGAGNLSVDARRRVAGGGGVRRGRVVTGTNAPGTGRRDAPVRRGGFMDRFRRR